MSRAVILPKALCLCLVLAIPSVGLTQSIEITTPTPDSIVTGDSFVAEFHVQNENGRRVVAALDGLEVESVHAGDGVWRANIVNLGPGLHLLRVQCGQASAECLVTADPSLRAIGPQSVHLEWTALGEQKLRDLLQTTMATPLTIAQLRNYSQTIREQVAMVVERNYLNFNLEVVDQDTGNCHLLEFISLSDNAFGRHDGNDGQVVPQSASIHIGTFFDELATPEKLARWTPMQLNDSPAVRCEDLAELIGRTATHELGHIFKLVSLQDAAGHNPADPQHGAHRFNGGRYIMDSNGQAMPVLRYARLGAHSDEEREPRVPAVFNNFNHSYLLHLLR